MKKTLKYLVFAFTLLTFSLLIFNSIKMQYWHHLKIELESAVMLFVLGFICLLISFLKKNSSKVFMKLAIFSFGICFLLNFHLFLEHYEVMQKHNRLVTYNNIKTCEAMKSRFKIDLKNKELKYFDFGIASMMGMDKVLKSEYQIEYYSMGCLVRSEMLCYNKLVENYLKEKYNTSVTKIYENSDIYKAITSELK